MKELHIRAASFSDIRVISELAAEQRYAILISDGFQAVNAKSLLGIFSLKFDRPLRLQLYCSESEHDSFRNNAAEFLAS